MQLKNDMLRVEFDASSGGFTSIYDSRTGYEYVVAPDRALLFRAMMPTDGCRSAHIDAAQAQIVVKEDTAVITCECDRLTAVATLRLERDAIVARLRLTNTSDTAIEETIFPYVRGLGQFPEAAIVWPNFWRRKFADPFGEDLGRDHHTWNEWTQKVVSRYPQHQASAWVDLGNSGQGLALEGRHNDFSIMDFFVHKVVEKTYEPVRRTLDLATVHPRRVMPGETWESPPVRVLVHEGDWHVVADEHRAWLETWVGKPDRPAKFAESIGWHFFFMKHQDDVVLNTYAELGAMAEASLAAGCPYLLVFGWQTGGHDNNYMYRYVPNEEWGGVEALRRGIEDARARGVSILPFFNGTISNIELPEHKEFGHRWVCKTREGHPLYGGDWARHNYDIPTRNRAMLHYELCPCDEQREYFMEIVERVVNDYGFGNLQLDQIAEKMFPCYDPTHHHTTPDRAYVDGYADLLSRTRRILREAHPDGVMISEALNDFTGQWCDSSWDWNILLPFPEPILYTLPWLMASHEVDACEYAEVNKAFAYCMHLDMKIDGGDAPITKYPEFAAHVKRLAELRRRVKDYYVYADFRDQVGVVAQDAENAIAKVFHDRARGRVGIVVAELSGRPNEVTLQNRWKSSSGSVRMISSLGRELETGYSERLRLVLQPFEVFVVCIDTN